MSVLVPEPMTPGARAPGAGPASGARWAPKGKTPQWRLRRAGLGPPIRMRSGARGGWGAAGGAALRQRGRDSRPFPASAFLEAGKPGVVAFAPGPRRISGSGRAEGAAERALPHPCPSGTPGCPRRRRSDREVTARGPREPALPGALEHRSPRPCRFILTKLQT